MESNKYREQCERVWSLVMREGRSVEAVAEEFDTTPARLERILRAIGRRRVAKSVSGMSTRKLRAASIAERNANRSKEGSITRSVENTRPGADADEVADYPGK